MSVEVRVTGLRELRRALRAAENVDNSRALSAGLKRAAEVVARDAQGRVPSRTGRTRASVRAVSGGSRAFVAGGKAKVPHYGWLDFGSRSPRTGQPRSVGPWANSGKGPSKGRVIYPALDAKRSDVVRLVEDAVEEALDNLGL